MKLRIIIYILLILHTASCSKYFWGSPAPIKFSKYGSYSMLKGLREGCNSAHSSRGNSFQRVLFKFELSHELIEDIEYFDSWYRGYIYCFHVVHRRAFAAGGQIDDRMQPEHSWFWNKNNEGNPGIKWPLDQGIPFLNYGDGIKLPGQQEGWHWNKNLFGGNCKGVWQCGS